MSTPRVQSIACSSPSGIHRMAYYDWGDPDNPDVLLCVHGLTRNGRDFDKVAERLSKRYRVISPDIVGRGLSDWLAKPAGYQVPQYAADIITLLGRLQPKNLDWIGTSMGGLIAMVYCGLVAKTQRAGNVPPARRHATIPEPCVPIRKLILNDVGPRVEPESILRIGGYVGESLSFASYADALAYIRQASASFGLQTDEQWDQFARHYFVEKDAQWIKHYDPAIAEGFVGMTPESMERGEQYLWGIFEKITATTLVLHGVESDLLTDASVARMKVCNPRVSSVDLPGVGHAPSLMLEHEIDLVEKFLCGV